MVKSTSEHWDADIRISQRLDPCILRNPSPGLSGHLRRLPLLPGPWTAFVDYDPRIRGDGPDEFFGPV